MRPSVRGYETFLRRLADYERFEPLPRSRGPEKLDAVRRLAAELGHPERTGRVVHIAGTNGKGMTAAMIARLLHAAGEPTGLYTSPHVLDVRERIGLDGAPIAPAPFAEAGHAVLDVADRLRASLHFSYFDLLTLMAWVAFRRAGLRWIVLETGLGGRSDATNIGPKELCVLTRIGMDHMHVLGDTLQAIAAQKLGIVPPGVTAVLAAQEPALEPWLLERLAAQGSPVRHAAEVQLAWPGADAAPTADAGMAADAVPTAEPAADAVSPADAVRVRWGGAGAEDVPLPGAGARLTAPRLACAATALVAAEVLLGPAQGPARAARLRTALATDLPGRLELRHGQAVRGLPGPPLATVVLDGGHNAEALEALGIQLRRWRIGGYTLILSLQRDKLVDAVRAPLAALLAAAHRVVTLAPQTVRAPEPAELAAFLAALRPGAAPAIETVPDAAAALAVAAREPARPVVATGSFWMLGDVMRLLADAPAPSPPAQCGPTPAGTARP
jgi:dihydrofolate synthase/folylpolyglutamate synthase